MAVPGDRQHKPPQPTEPLPRLTQAERAQLVELARLLKAGLIRDFRVEYHEKDTVLKVDWASKGGGRKLK